MWRMNARLTRAGRDRGATAVIIAILMPVVLLGLGAIVIDVGSFYAERAQTQNGADAGAIAVAQSCARGTCTPSLATNYAPANSVGNLDTTSQVTTGFPCGKEPSNVLTPCPAGSENGSICPQPAKTPAGAAIPYVDVLTNTAKNDGSGTPFVARFLDQAFNVGKNPPTNNGYTKSAIGACAQATWGPPGSLGNGSALTMSSCEWYKDTANGKQFGAVPSFNSNGTPNYSYQSQISYPPNAPGGLPSYLDTLTARRADTTGDYLDSKNLNYYVDNTIQDPHTVPRSYVYPVGISYPPTTAPPTAQVAGSETVLTTIGFGSSCKEGNSGGTAPGQFGWLSDKSCSVVIDGSTYGGSPGASAAPCEVAFVASRNTGQPIFLPVYSGVTPGTTGNNAQYNLLGFAAFIVTGWDMSNAVAGNFKNPNKVVPSLVSTADTSVPSAKANYCGKKPNGFTGSNADQCVYGFFTQALVTQSQLPGGGGPGGVSLGATTAFLNG